LVSHVAQRERPLVEKDIESSLQVLVVDREGQVGRGGCQHLEPVGPYLHPARGARFLDREALETDHRLGGEVPRGTAGFEDALDQTAPSAARVLSAAAGTSRTSSHISKTSLATTSPRGIKSLHPVRGGDRGATLFFPLRLTQAGKALVRAPGVRWRCSGRRPRLVSCLQTAAARRLPSVRYRLSRAPQAALLGLTHRRPQGRSFPDCSTTGAAESKGTAPPHDPESPED